MPSVYIPSGMRPPIMPVTFGNDGSVRTLLMRSITRAALLSISGNAMRCLPAIPPSVLACVISDGLVLGMTPPAVGPGGVVVAGGVVVVPVGGVVLGGEGGGNRCGIITMPSVV